jgi:hypothetical protein
MASDLLQRRQAYVLPTPRFPARKSSQLRPEPQVVAARSCTGTDRAVAVDALAVPRRRAVPVS